ncbi:MAG: Hpt domain-containing protein [Paracoccaceae bacterium]
MIDWERVNELRQEVGQEDFLEVVDIFLEEVEEVASRLRNTPDPATYEHDLHFLKGGAMNLGFQALTQICQSGEKLAANNDAASVDISALLSVYDQSMREFNGGTPAESLVA